MGSESRIGVGRRRGNAEMLGISNFNFNMENDVPCISVRLILLPNRYIVNWGIR